MPCTGCTEPEFPFFDLVPGTVFKTQKISGTIPKDMPAGLDRSVTWGLPPLRVSPRRSGRNMFVV
jgi:hydrogenase small subunit